MKLEAKYSYEFNCVLNDRLNEKDQISNFASLLSDKDRFLSFVPLLTQNREFLKKKLGFPLLEYVEFFIVRCEKFKSFSEPVTIEYSILCEEMLLFLLKEIIKVSCPLRFPDEQMREEFINAFIDFCAINGDWSKVSLIKFTKNLHEESSRNYPSYSLKQIDFSNKTLKEYLEEEYKNLNI